MALLRFIRSSIGLKIIMALTGVGLFGFVLVHMIGNLQLFLGPDSINSYAHFLKSKPEFLWPARIGLLAMAVIHVWAGISLAALNRAARPVDYCDNQKPGASLASRTMVYSGLLVLAFIVYHLLHFTVGLTNPDFFNQEDAFGRHDVWSMVVRSFQVPYISVIYIVAVVLLGFHLSHGLFSMFRSLGLVTPAYRRPQQIFATTFASIIVIGMVIIPIAVLLGFYGRS